jgi:hypothetical protein
VSMNVRREGPCDRRHRRELLLGMAVRPLVRGFRTL